MKRAAFLYSLLFICLAVETVAFGQSDARSIARKGCPFSIVGMWRSETTTQTNPIFFSFSSDGWVRLQGHSADALPQDFEVIAEMKYKLDQPAAPKRLEFAASGGNELFPSGVTSMQIIDYSEDSFTTINHESGQRTRWVKEKTRRFFLTFAARGEMLQQGGAAFAMLSALDGRKIEIEAIGVQLTRDDEGNPLPVFSEIPAELYNQIAEQSDKDKKVKKSSVAIMRLELNSAEFERAHSVFQIWDKYVKTRALPYDDPYLNGMEFIKKAAESLNRCGEGIKLHKLNLPQADDIARHNISERPMQYIKAMRKNNGEEHVTDAFFPWGWRPTLQLSEQ